MFYRLSTAQDQRTYRINASADRRNPRYTALNTNLDLMRIAGNSFFNISSFHAISSLPADFKLWYLLCGYLR
jgi:hypothetical protein